MDGDQSVLASESRPASASRPGRDGSSGVRAIRGAGSLSRLESTLPSAGDAAGACRLSVVVLKLPAVDGSCAIALLLSSTSAPCAPPGVASAGPLRPPLASKKPVARGRAGVRAEGARDRREAGGGAEKDAKSGRQSCAASWIWRSSWWWRRTVAQICVADRCAAQMLASISCSRYVTRCSASSSSMAGGGAAS